MLEVLAAARGFDDTVERDELGYHELAHVILLSSVERVTIFNPKVE
jgi:hypothetical protein